MSEHQLKFDWDPLPMSGNHKVLVDKTHCFANLTDMVESDGIGRRRQLEGAMDLTDQVIVDEIDFLHSQTVF